MSNQNSDLIERIISLNPKSDDTAEALAEAIISCAEDWHRDLREVSMQGQKGAADWLGFETRLWQLGESMRQVLSKKTKWRKSEKLLCSIAEILGDSKYGKGRQSFIDLIAKFGGPVHYSDLLAAIDEPEIAGHAVKGLRLAKVSGAESKVEALLNTKQPAWVKREAKKYLRLFEKGKNPDL